MSSNKFNNYTARQWGEAAITAANYAAGEAGILGVASCGETVRDAVDTLVYRAESAESLYEKTRAVSSENYAELTNLKRQNGIDLVAMMSVIASTVTLPELAGLFDLKSVLADPGSRPDDMPEGMPPLSDRQAVDLTATTVIGVLADEVVRLRDRITGLEAIAESFGVSQDNVEVTRFTGTDAEVEAFAEAAIAGGADRVIAVSLDDDGRND